MKAILKFIGYTVLILFISKIFVTWYGSSLSTSVDNPVADIEERAEEIKRIYDDSEGQDMDEFVNSQNYEKLIELTKANGQSFDEILIKLGAVDSDYRYIDLTTANTVFRQITSDIQKSLPDFGDGVTTTEIEMTPFSNSYTYVSDQVLSPESLNATRANLANEAFIKAYCGNFFVSEYQKVNNTEVRILNYDNSYTLIAEIRLNNDTCY